MSTPPPSQENQPVPDEEITPARRRFNEILREIDLRGGARLPGIRTVEEDDCAFFPHGLLVPFADASMLYWWKQNAVYYDDFNKPKVHEIEADYRLACRHTVNFLNTFLCRSNSQLNNTVYYIYRSVIRIQLVDVANEWTPISLRVLQDILGKYKLYFKKSISSGQKKDGTPKSRTKMEEKSIVDVWRNHPEARFIDNFRFDPKSKPGLCEILPTAGPPLTIYNYWKGLDTNITKLPLEENAVRNVEKLDILLYHLRAILCRGDDRLYEWMLKWMAHCLKYPHLKMEVVPIFTGPQGSGKSFFWERFSKLFGVHGLVLPDANLLVHKFGGKELSNKVFLVANEVDYRNIGPGQLKNLITNQSAQVEKKFQDLSIEPVFYNMVWTSNNPVPILVESGPNRRFLLINVSEDKVGDKGYFAGAVWCMDDEGLFLLYHYLMQQEIQLNDPELNEAPMTEEKSTAVAQKFDTVEQFWYHCLQLGQHVGHDCGPTTCSRESPMWRNSVDKSGPYGLYTKFTEWLHKNKQENWSASRFYRELHELLPDPPRAVRAHDAKFFHMPSLVDCREYFFKKTKVTCGEHEPTVIERNKRKLDEAGHAEAWKFAVNKRKAFEEKDYAGTRALSGWFLTGK